MDCNRNDPTILGAKLAAAANKVGVRIRVTEQRTGIGDDLRQIAAEQGIEIPPEYDEEESTVGGIGSGGHRQKPRALKVLEGTHRPSRDSAQKVKAEEKTDQAKGLDPIASKHWNAVAERTWPFGWPSPTKQRLTALCETWSLYRRTKDLYDQDLTNFACDPVTCHCSTHGRRWPRDSG